MPRPVPAPRQRKTTRETLPDVLWRYLLDALDPEPEDGSADAWTLFYLQTKDGEARRVWEQFAEEVLQEFIRRKPGMRPSMWWEFSAPRASDTELRCWGISEGDFLWRPEERPCSPRQRLEPNGKICFDAWHWPPGDCLGLPPNCDPAEYETQHAYLLRHGLLMPFEKQKGRNNATER